MEECDGGFNPNISEQEVLQNQLFVAAFWGFDDIVKTHVKVKEINLNFKSASHGITPLHAATFNEHGKCAMALLVAGADPLQKV